MDSPPASSRSPNTAPPITDSTTADTERLGSLVTGIVEDLQDIVRGEMALVKAEIKDEATTLGTAAVTLVISALVALVGFIFLMLGVTYLLNKSQEWKAMPIPEPARAARRVGLRAHPGPEPWPRACGPPSSTLVSKTRSPAPPRP